MIGFSDFTGLHALVGYRSIKFGLYPLSGSIKLLRYFPLHIQFFLHFILVKAVVQTA